MMRDDGLSENTVRNRWIALRSLYRWLVEEEELEQSPLARITVQRPETPPPDVLSDETSGRSSRPARARTSSSAATTPSCGSSPAPGCASPSAPLQEADIDLVGRVVIIHKGKGGKTRLVRIDPETAAAIDRYLRVRSRHRCAGLPDLWIGHRGRFGSKGIQTMVTQRAGDAGLGHVHVHQLRHSYAHRFLEARRQRRRPATPRRLGRPKVMRRYGTRSHPIALAAADRVTFWGTCAPPRSAQRVAAEIRADHREMLDRAVLHAESNVGRVLVEVRCARCQETIGQVYETPDGPFYFAPVRLKYDFDPETARLRKETLPSGYKWRKTFRKVAVLVELDPDAALETRDCGDGSRLVDREPILGRVIRWGQFQPVVCAGRGLSTG